MKEELEFNGSVYTIETKSEKHILAYKNDEMICNCMDKATARQVIYTAVNDEYMNSEKKLELEEPYYLYDYHFEEI